MAVFKVKSLDPQITDEQLEHQGCYSISFMSFYRAIEETMPRHHTMDDLKGYRVTDQGIEIIWK